MHYRTVVTKLPKNEHRFIFFACITNVSRTIYSVTWLKLWQILASLVMMQLILQVLTVCKVILKETNLRRCCGKLFSSKKLLIKVMMIEVKQFISTNQKWVILDLFKEEIVPLIRCKIKDYEDYEVLLIGKSTFRLLTLASKQIWMIWIFARRCIV